MKTDANFWLKVGFIIFVFFESFLTGLIPTWSKGCRESPAILGIANSFAGGVFLAIALVHILPEQTASYIEYKKAKGGPAAEDDEFFPLPEFLVFCGYTLILIIDKVMFDTHALFDHEEDGFDDPIDRQLSDNIRNSFVAGNRMSIANGEEMDTSISKKELQENMQ